jgi:general secretion pathway protein D
MKATPSLLLLLASLALVRSSLAADTASSTNSPAPAPAASAALAQPAPPAPPAAPAAAPAPAPATPPPAAAATNAAPASPTVISSENTTNGLRMNFHNAPLNLVLDYLVDAAGFIINKRTDVSGSVEISSSGSISKDEAVDLLNSVLKQNGYGVTRKGRILTIIRMETAKTDNLPIVQGNNPEDVEESDEVVTQIIPVRYASVGQLTANLEMLLPSNATLSANEGANSLIMVATKTDIKRMLKIIDALDTSIASVSSIKVIPLKYADSKDTANLITQLFSGSSTSQGGGGRGNLFNMFGGGPGGFGGFGGRGGFGGGGNAGASGGSGRTSAAGASKVVAVGDDRSNSLIISAPSDLLTTIAEMVEKIDQPISDETELRVFRLANADPTEVATQLGELFPDDSSTTGASQNNMPFFMRGPMGGGNSRSSSSDASQRTKKLGKVIPVADPRTSSLIVTASKTVMPQIAEMINELDSHPDKKEVVMVYDLKNADPVDVSQVLQDLFNRTTTRQNNNNNNTLLGNSNPLRSRSLSTSTSATGTSTVGSLGTSSRTGSSGN